MLHTGMTIKATEKITLQGFMSKPNSEVYQVVKPTIQMGARKKRITAVVVDELPQAIATEGLTAVKERLMSTEITLADTEVNTDRFCGTAHNDSQCTEYVSGIDRIN